MNQSHFSRQRGFTLLETVIAIGVLAVLLTGFMVVFAPAAEGIRKSINIQHADRLASTLERELVTPRETNNKTGFDKAFEWIKGSSSATDALLIYQYRGSVSDLRSDDKTPTPVPNIQGKNAGSDYVVVPMVRLRSDTTKLKADLDAVEGAVYVVKCTQLVFNAGGLTLGKPGEIKDPKDGPVSDKSDAYPEAVIAFSAEFHQLPSKSYDYVSGAAFSNRFANAKNPVFTRNLAVRR
jgi:prepilin-type N-terminal cleavage/methylation domain-containing protein